MIIFAGRRRDNIFNVTCGGVEHIKPFPVPVSMSIGGRVGGGDPCFHQQIYIFSAYKYHRKK